MAERIRAAELSPALIIGTGLLGTSVAHALTRAGVKVHLSDKSGSHAKVASSLGAGTTDAPDAAAVRLVVVAVPPKALAKVIAKALDSYPNATVTDVGSVKGTVLASLRRSEVDLGRYVGSHPMAGSQRNGPLTASANLFADRTWVVTPHDTSEAHAVLDVQHLAELCGARMVSMAAAHHDEAVAQVSHLPHLVSVLMAERLTKIPPEHLTLAGQGVRDVTRIAGSDPDLWLQIITANTKAVRRELKALQSDLGRLLEAIEADELADWLELGRAGVNALPGKHGLSRQAWAEVVVGIPDTPGALAGLFADIEAAGVNVEDLAIDHDPVREVGWLSVQVRSEDVAELVQAMVDGGWQVRDQEPQR